MFVSVQINGKDFEKGSKKFVSGYTKLVDKAVIGTNKKMLSNMKGLRRLFTDNMRSHLDHFGEYSASGKLKLKPHLVQLDRMVDLKKDYKNGLFDTAYFYQYDFPEADHNKIEYGYALGDTGTLLRPPYDVFAKYIIDKGTYTLDGDVVTDMKKAKRLAYIILQVTGGWGKPIKKPKPFWYVIDLKDSRVVSEMRKLNNLTSFYFKKEFDGER